MGRSELGMLPYVTPGGLVGQGAMLTRGWQTLHQLCSFTCDHVKMHLSGRFSSMVPGSVGSPYVWRLKPSVSAPT